MKVNHVHSFSLSIPEMKNKQRELQQKIEIAPYHGTPTFVAGVDVAYHQQMGIAVIIVMDFKSMQVVEQVWQIDQVTQEYIPGLLAFRELPLILTAWKKVTIEPEIVFFDGNGILHPNRVGIATHASFFLEKPTVGIAKTPFIGHYLEPDPQRGSYTFIYEQDEMIGASLRTQPNVKPVYISVGNLIDLDSSIHLSMQLVGKTSRIPEITRQADILTRKIRREYLSHPN
ncbi:Endonuclease V [Seinonella peptonophila]|uniref:Endonuclease V n=1 Tax=Seinonella peptonophila TaxID=112248 RepID=A0A1M4SP04_9BACL|nr:endonuclease V [Seinonella peptonophila]SHE33926.1 Endonuclease V [Seinonella peptonophila]